MIIYLKEKSRGVEIKTEITWDDFKLVTMMFVYEGDFPTSGKKTDNRWDEVLQQNKIRVYDWSGYLRVSGENLNMEK